MSDDIDDMEIDLLAHSPSSYKLRKHATKVAALARTKPKWKRQLRAIKGHAKSKRKVIK